MSFLTPEFAILFLKALNIDFPECRIEIAASLNELSNRWCNQNNDEPDALKIWKMNIFKIIVTRISFYSRNTHLLPPKPKSSFRHLKRGIQDFHMNFVLVPAMLSLFDGCIILILLNVSLLTLMPKKLQVSLSESAIVDGYGFHTALHFFGKAKF